MRRAVRWILLGVVAIVGPILAAVLLIVGVVAWGSFSPAERRDRDRQHDLATIAIALHERYGLGKHAKLPDFYDVPPQYRYHKIDDSNYQLCATFENDRPGGYGTWAHGLGNYCFRLSVYNKPWDPISRSWFNWGC